MRHLEPSSSETARGKRTELWVLIGILALAALLRLWGVGFGLPYEYHVDEVQYVRQGVSMGERGLEPVWWNNPPFYKYLLFGEFAGLFAVGRLAGWYASAADFGAKETLDPTSLYVLGRGTSAVFGVLTVVALYWLGKEAYNRRVGLLAAFFLAVCFIHVRESHYAVNDVPTTFFNTLVLLTSVMIVTSGERKWYALSGAALGLGFATKYSAAVAMIPLLLAHFLSPGVQVKRQWHLQLRRLGVALAVAVLASILGSPYFVLEPGKVIHDAYQSLYVAGQQGFDGWQIDPAGGYLFYLKSLSWGLGAVLLMFSIAGLIVAMVRHSRVDLVLVALPIVMYAFMGHQRMYFERFALPMVPPMLVVGASLVEKFPASLANSQRGTAVGLLLAALVIGAQPLAFSARSDYLLTKTDTRTLAKQWIEASIPDGARIALDRRTHGPPLSTSETPMPNSKRKYNVLLVGQSGLSEHSIDWYRQQGFDYLIASSFIYNIPLLDRERDVLRRDFYTSLDRELELVQEFRSSQERDEPPFIFDEVVGPAISLWHRERPGPTLKLFKVR